MLLFLIVLLFLIGYKLFCVTVNYIDQQAVAAVRKERFNALYAVEKEFLK